MFIKLIKNNYVFSLLTKFILVFFGVINSVLINRYLGPSLKGEYAYVLNIVNIIVLILNLGIYQSYPYFKRKGIENMKQKYFNIFLFQFIIYFTIGVLISLVFKRYDYTIICTLIPLMVLANQLNFITLIENINLRNMINIVNTVFYTVSLFIVFVFVPQNFFSVIALLYVKDIVIISSVISKFKLKLNIKNIDFSLLIKLIKFGIYPMLTILLITLNYQVDIIILKIFVDFEQIGYYTVGVGLANQIWLIPDAFKEVLFSKTAAKDSVEDIILSLKINLYVCLIIVIFILIVGKPLIVLLYGIQYINSYNVTVIIFLGIIPMIFFKLINVLFVAKGKQKLSFKILVVAVTVNIIGNYIFIPLYGINGAAITSVISYSVCGCFFLYKFMKEFNLNLSDVLLINENEIKRIKRFRHR